LLGHEGAKLLELILLRSPLLLLFLPLLLPVLFDEQRVKLLLLPLPLSTPLLLLDHEGTELLELMLLR
jgi:hypothetical protein